MDTLAAVAASKSEDSEEASIKGEGNTKTKEANGESSATTPTKVDTMKSEERDDNPPALTATEDDSKSKEDVAEPDTEEEEEGEEEDSTMTDAVESAEVAVAPAKNSKQAKAAVKAKKIPTKRRKKSKKPPNYPKRPLSAYNIFFKDTREKIITEHGKTNFQEMVRLIAARWRIVSEEEKKKFEGKAAKDLVRYKKEVSVYEKGVAEKKRAEQERQAFLNEKNREQERTLLAAQQKRNAEASSGVRLVNGRFDEDGDKGAGVAARFPFNTMGRDQAMLAALGGGGGGGSRDLEMARLRLEQDLRGIEEARALRLRQLELAHMQGGGGGLRGTGGMFGGGGLNDNLELELQRRYLGGNGDHIGISNEQELRQRLAEEQLLRESNFGASLGLTGRFGAYSSAVGMGGQGMGLSNPYEEILLREQMLRREREALLGSGGASSLYGGGLGVAGLGTLGLGGNGGVGGLWGANSAVADADMHTNAAAAGLASLRGQSSYIPGSHLERLSDDELRALSSGRGLDAISNGASAFNRVEGEASKQGVKGERN